MKKGLAVLLALVLPVGLAACAGPAQSVPASSSSSAPPASVSVPVASSSQPAPVVLNQAFLTGESKTVDYPEGQRITAVMVNNIAKSRPTRGVSQAKVVVEIQVEGPITRLMCLFEGYKTMPEVGSVRSARDQFLQLLIPFRGFYVHDGPGRGKPHPVNMMLDIYEYGAYDLQPDSGAAYRISRPGMDFEFTEYTDSAHIQDAVLSKGVDDYHSYGSPIFNFVPYTEEAYVPAEGQASEIGVIFNAGYRTLLSYNSESSRYDMSMFSEYTGAVSSYIDEGNGQQVSFDNVVVIFAPMQRYNASELMKVDYSQGGGGYVFTRGGYESVIWRKGAPDQPLALKKFNNEEEFVPLNVGTTYLAVVNDIEGPAFAEVLAAGNAGAAVGAGEVNTGREDIDQDEGDFS